MKTLQEILNEINELLNKSDSMTEEEIEEVTHVQNLCNTEKKKHEKRVHELAVIWERNKPKLRDVVAV